MAKSKKKPGSSGGGVVLFDVVYDDGTLNSNRKVPAEILGGLDGDEPARTYLEDKEQAIAAASGRPRANIKSIARSKKQ